MTGATVFKGEPWAPPCQEPVTCPPWICRTCGHRIYEHATRREPNSGIRYYSACKLDGCPCSLGENHRYPRGAIDT